MCVGGGGGGGLSRFVLFFLFHFLRIRVFVSTLACKLLVACMQATSICTTNVVNKFLVDGKTINSKHKAVTIGFFFTDNMFNVL